MNLQIVIFAALLVVEFQVVLCAMRLSDICRMLREINERQAKKNGK